MKFFLLFVITSFVFFSCKEDTKNVDISQEELVRTISKEPELSSYRKIDSTKVSIKNEKLESTNGSTKMGEYVPPATPLPNHIVKKRALEKIANDKIADSERQELIGFYQTENKNTKKELLKSENTNSPSKVKSKKEVSLEHIREKKSNLEKVINKKKKRIKKKRKVGVKSKGKLQFEEDTFNFGVLTEGDELDHVFVFRNVGQSPISIKNVKVSCGCTTPGYPFVDVMPGDKNKITVHYSTKNKWSHQNPSLTIYTNGDPAEYKVYLEGDVHERPKEDTIN